MLNIRKIVKNKIAKTDLFLSKFAIIFFLNIFKYSIFCIFCQFKCPNKQLSQNLDQIQKRIASKVDANYTVKKIADSPELNYLTIHKIVQKYLRHGSMSKKLDEAIGDLFYPLI